MTRIGSPPWALPLLAGILLLMPIESAGMPTSSGYLLEPVGSMRWPRQSHEATRLADGRVAITGGSIIGARMTSRHVEIFDPATRTFEEGPRLLIARSNHAALQLPDGRLLVAGGDTLSYVVPTASAEILDLASGTSTRIQDMAVPRGHAPFLALASDGSAWIFGGSIEGRFGEVTEVVERLAPGATAWSIAGSLLLPCTGHWLTFGADRVVRLAGGSHRAGGNAVGAACRIRGEEWTLRPGSRPRLIPMTPPLRSQDNVAAGIAGGRVVALTDQAAWRLGTSSFGWRPVERLLPSTSVVQETSLVAWSEDEVVIPLEDIVILHPKSGRPPSRVPWPGSDGSTLTVLSEDELLICGGTASSDESGEWIPATTWILRRVAAESAHPVPSASSAP